MACGSGCLVLHGCCRGWAFPQRARGTSSPNEAQLRLPLLPLLLSSREPRLLLPLHRARRWLGELQRGEGVEESALIVLGARGPHLHLCILLLLLQLLQSVCQQRSHLRESSTSAGPPLPLPLPQQADSFHPPPTSSMACSLLPAGADWGPAPLDAPLVPGAAPGVGPLPPLPRVHREGVASRSSAPLNSSPSSLADPGRCVPCAACGTSLPVLASITNADAAPAAAAAKPLRCLRCAWRAASHASVAPRLGGLRAGTNANSCHGLSVAGGWAGLGLSGATPWGCISCRQRLRAAGAALA